MMCATDTIEDSSSHVLTFIGCVYVLAKLTLGKHEGRESWADQRLGQLYSSAEYSDGCAHILIRTYIPYTLLLACSDPKPSNALWMRRKKREKERQKRPPEKTIRVEMDALVSAQMEPG